jgi:hypothetical protein
MKRAETDQEDIQSLARAHAADAIAVLAEIMNNPDAPAGARLSAAKALLDRGWGKAGAKPPEDGNRAKPVSQIRRVIVDPRQRNAKRPSQPANAASLELQAHSTELIGIPVEQTRSGGQRGIARNMLGHVPRPRYARIARRPSGRLTPKIACRQFCRVRSGLPKANKMVQWTILSDERVRPPPSGPPIKNPAQGRVFIGGQRGIRTLERLSPLHTFQACAFNHSATCPHWKRGDTRPGPPPQEPVKSFLQKAFRPVNRPEAAPPPHRAWPRRWRRYSPPPHRTGTSG